MTEAPATAPWNGFLVPHLREQTPRAIDPQPRGPSPGEPTPGRERTPWLLAFLCLLIPILPGYSVPPGPLKSYGSPSKLIAVVLLVLVILGFLLVRREAAALTIRPGVVIVLVYFAAMLAVYGMGAIHPGTPLVEAARPRAIVVVCANVGIALYAMTRAVTTRQRAIVLGALAVGLTFDCIAGFLENAANIDLHLLFQPPGFVVNTDHQGATTSPIASVRSGAKRASATAGHPIEFSVLAAIAVPLAIHYVRYASTQLLRLAALVATVVALMAVPASVSRSGAITLAVAMFVYVWTFKVRELAVGAVAGVVALVGVFIASPTNLEALWQTISGSADDESVLDRVSDYAKVSATFREHPIFGLGLGGDPPTEYGVLDNEWLQTVVQGGSIGLLGMVLLAGGGIFGIAAALRYAKTPRERDQAYMIGAMWIGMLASSFTFDIFSFQQAAMLFFLLYGLLWSYCAVPIPGVARRGRRFPADPGDRFVGDA